MTKLGCNSSKSKGAWGFCGLVVLGAIGAVSLIAGCHSATTTGTHSAGGGESSAGEGGSSNGGSSNGGAGATPSGGVAAESGATSTAGSGGVDAGGKSGASGTGGTSAGGAAGKPCTSNSECSDGYVCYSSTSSCDRFGQCVRKTGDCPAAMGAGCPCLELPSPCLGDIGAYCSPWKPDCWICRIPQ